MSTEQEGVLKLTLALAELVISGELPTPKRLRNDYRHNIVALTDAVVEQVATYMRRPAVRTTLTLSVTTRT
jgi:hypothetical protein